MQENIQPSKGRLLISAPFLNDIFKRSVIILAEHNEEGSVGFILNKLTDYKLHEIIEDFPHFDAPVYIGGPVQQNSLNFIHKAKGILEGGFEIADGLYWGGNFEELKILIESDSINAEDFKFFLGYAGWNPDQLNEEIKTISWYLHDPTPENIFSNQPKHLWRDVLKSMGKDYSLIASFPEDPSVN
ncbi:MAG: YqgE/AlgH family protein [Ignavibacteria bacterium]